MSGGKHFKLGLLSISANQECSCYQFLTVLANQTLPEL